MTPRTLADLRAAVGRVLAARGERADALRVTCDRVGAHRRVSITAADMDGALGLALGDVEDGNVPAAVAEAWRRFAARAVDTEGADGDGGRGGDG